MTAEFIRRHNAAIQIAQEARQRVAERVAWAYQNTAQRERLRREEIEIVRRVIAR